MFASSAVIRAAARKSFGSSRNVVTVTGVLGREIIDSRGNPTVEVDVHTTAGRFRGAYYRCYFLSVMIVPFNSAKLSKWTSTSFRTVWSFHWDSWGRWIAWWWTQIQWKRRPQGRQKRHQRHWAGNQRYSLLLSSFLTTKGWSLNINSFFCTQGWTSQSKASSTSLW